MKRHVAKKNSISWYRTIDRIVPSLTNTPKLLIPDIKGDANIVFDKGEFYPHHNLYYIVSKKWDLHILQAVLLSGIAKLFVFIYSTRMHGGCFRFQAQYLRRIRVPHFENISKRDRQAILKALKAGDLKTVQKYVFRLYKLSQDEIALIQMLK